MNKTNLIDAIAEQTGTSKALTTEILNAFFETVQNEVAAGREVQVLGFGTFKRGIVPAGTTKNVQTREPVSYDASWTPKFKAGGDFKKTVKAAPISA